MRRPIVSVLFVLLCLLPVRAEANFWKWVDRLSGPQFTGFVVDFRVWCQWDPGVEVLRRDLLGRLDQYQRAAVGAADKRVYDAAAGLVQQALSRLDAAEATLRLKPAGDPSGDLQAAFRLREAAAAIFSLARLFGASPGATAAIDTALMDAKTSDSQVEPKGFVASGAVVSACGGRAFDRRRMGATIEIGYGLDTVDDNRDDHNRMVRLGGSYELVVNRYLSVGTGGGVAFFSSATAPSFSTLYLKPYIVDFRPFALKPGSQLAGPWWHVFFVRYETMTFPTGFREGRFGGRSPQYPAELVHSIGFHADFEPVLRKARRRW